MDSAGVGELVGAYMPVKFKGGELKFLNPTKKVLGMLQITQLDTLFEVYTDEQTAISELFLTERREETRSFPPDFRLRRALALHGEELLSHSFTRIRHLGSRLPGELCRPLARFPSDVPTSSTAHQAANRQTCLH
jgi:hypothetical protein